MQQDALVPHYILERLYNSLEAEFLNILALSTPRLTPLYQDMLDVSIMVMLKDLRV